MISLPLTLLAGLLAGVPALAQLADPEPALQQAPPPLWEGLPAELPADFLETGNFVELPELAHDDPALERPFVPPPFAVGIQFDGVSVSPLDRPRIMEVFTERTLAGIPPGTKIRSRVDPEGKTRWEYPIGARSAHWIGVRSDPPKLFELRLVWRVSEDRWAFGSYEPDPADPGRLRLLTYPDTKPEAFTVPLAGGREVAVKAERVRMAACQGCHFVQSPSGYQFRVFKPDGSLDVRASVKKTGPCAFGPGNPHIEQWVTNFRAAYGDEPIEPESR